jgi:hypothetical protein
MVEYKKKKLILQSGGTRNFYYKVTSDGKKKQVSKSEYLEKKGGTGENYQDDQDDPDKQNEILSRQLKNTLKRFEANNPSNDYINVLKQQIKNIEIKRRARKILKEKIILEKRKRENRLSKYPNSNSTSLLENLNNLIYSIERGQQNRKTYQEFHNKIIEILDKQIEIPEQYKWKDVFDKIKKIHFKNNGNIVIVWQASNTWEDSFVTSLWNSLFH